MTALADIGYTEIAGLVIGVILVLMFLMVSTKIAFTAITGKPPPFLRDRDSQEEEEDHELL